MSKWIKCDKRMPDLGQEVLVVDECGNRECAVYSNGNVTRGPEFFCSSGVVIPTYWQALPPLPKD